ncbi:MAG TPA: carbohydrate ABC transporter permease [Jatrophihabitantaceae bacterium]|jgi:multiple sugar transport system permease protein
MPADSLPRRLRWHAGLAATAILLLAPVGIAVLASFKRPNDLYDADPLPLHPTLGNYRVSLGHFPLERLLVNTLVTSTGVMLLQLAVATLAGYAMVRFRGRLGRVLLLAGTVAVLIPGQALLVPQFVMITHLGWLNSYQGLIVPQLSGCAVALLLLRQHVAAIPDSLGEAALLDGANSWQALWHVVLPVLRPALAAVGILVFINTWNEYLWPLLAAPRLPHSTIQLGLALFGNTEGANPGPLLAASTLATLPVLLGYLFAARRVTDAFMHSGIR